MRGFIAVTDYGVNNKYSCELPRWKGTGTNTVEETSEQTVNQVADTAQVGPEPSNVDGMLCPKAKMREIFWHTPFIIIFDLIFEAGTDFQEMNSQNSPTTNPRTFASRGRRHGAIEIEVGKIANGLTPHFVLDINMSRRASPQMSSRPISAESSSVGT